MRTKYRRQWLAMVAVGLALALPGLGGIAAPGGQGGLPAALMECEDDLEACLTEPCTIFPGDGWPEDADPSGGAPLSYTNNWDGTFTDDNTGLVWEIKTEDGSIHDVAHTYTWSATGTAPDGTAFDFIDQLNAEEFAGSDQWRLPTVKELQSLVDYSVGYLAVHDDLPGAITPYMYLPYYWASTPHAIYDSAWIVDFSYGSVS